MMPTRADGLVHTAEGFERSGVQLVAFENGAFFPSNGGGDLGLFYFGPKLARLFDVAVLPASRVFLIVLVLASVAIGMTGLLRNARSTVARSVGAIYLGLFGASLLAVDDVYVASFAIVAAIVPWLPAKLVPLRRHALVVAGYAGIGLFAGYASMIRSHAGTVLVLFALARLWTLHGRAWKKPLVLTLALIAGGVVPTLHGRLLVHHRDAFLAENLERVPPASHVLWHSVYIGFGYLQNPYGLRYLDECAIERVAEVDPSAPYLSRRYEEILRAEVAELIRRDPVFVAKTIAAKTWVLLKYFVFYGWLLIALSIWRPMPWRTALPYVLAGAFALIPGLVVIPLPIYIIGWTTLVVLATIASVDHAASFARGRR